MAVKDRVSARNVQLRCGRTVDELWDKVVAGEAEHDPHVPECRYCRSTVDGLTALLEATAELVAEAPQAPPSLSGTVMRAVRTEARRGETMELFGGTDAAQVSLRAVSGMVRVVVDAYDELSPLTVRAAAGAEIDQVDVRIAAEWAGAHPTDVEQRLRQQVATMLALGVGLRLGRLQLRLESQ